MGACIGVSFALALAQARPGLVTSLVLQNPIGLSPENRAALDHEFDQWAKEVSGWPNIDPAALPAFGKRMFGGDFIFSVTPRVRARMRDPDAADARQRPRASGGGAPTSSRARRTSRC